MNTTRMEELTQGPKMFQIFAKLLDGKTAILRFTAPSVSGHDIKDRIFDITRIPARSQRLICGGTQLRDHSIVSTPECTVHVALRLVGGKGGFGSLLRGAATKAGQKKTNNFDACRDMSGRRLRHVNAEKRLEEWKAEEEERRLEKMAEEFIKKKAKKGKKGVGDGEAQKYVEMYREESAKCTKEVEEAVREACGIGKRKKKAELEGVDAKRLKIWMGKGKLGGSDSEDMDEDSSDDDERENEKSVVLNDGNHSDSSKEANGSSDSVTGGKHNGELSNDTSSMSGSEEERGAHVEQKFNGSTFEDFVHNEEVKPEISAETVTLSPTENPESELSRAEKQDNVGTEDLTISKNGEVTVNEPDANGLSQSKSELNEVAVLPSVENCDAEKPLDFNEFSSAADLEVLGLERLKIELQNRGLKCGGSLQERAARLFLLKSTPLEKLPKKLFAKK